MVVGAMFYTKKGFKYSTLEIVYRQNIRLEKRQIKQ